MSGNTGTQSKLLYLVVILLLSISAIGVLKKDIVVAVIPALLALMYTASRVRYLLKAILIHGALTALSSSDLYVAIPSAICSALIVLGVFGSRGKKKATESIIVAASHTPLYIYATPSLLNGLSVALVILWKYVSSYAAVSTAKSRIRREVYEATPGTPIEIDIELEARSILNWRAYVDSVEVARLENVDRGVVRFSLVERYIGERRRRLSVTACDPWGFYRRKIAQVDIVVKVVPRLGELLRRVERLLARYASTILPPEIYRAVPIFPAKLLSATGGSGVSLGTGAGTTVEGRYLEEVLAKNMSVGEEVGSEIKRGIEGAGEVLGVAMVWLPFTRLYSAIEELIGALSHYGEYVGARDYYPGDSLRRIHWKKSVSLNKLVVKEYSRSAGGQGREGAVNTLVVDWVSTNPVDLDQVVGTTLELLLTFPPTKNCLMILTTQSGNLYLITGRTVDVLSAVYLLAKNETPLPYYDYRLEKHISTTYIVRGGRVLEQLYEYYEALANMVLKTLLDNGATPGTSIAMVYNPPTSAKYSIIALRLSSGGYFVNVIKASE